MIDSVDDSDANVDDYLATNQWSSLTQLNYALCMHAIYSAKLSICPLYC